MPRGERPLHYPAGGEPFLPPSRPPLPRLTRVPRGEAGAAGIGILWHNSVGPFRGRMSRIRMRAARGRQLPAGSGAPGDGAGPWVSFSLPVPPLSPFPPPLLEALRCRRPLRAVSASKTKFPPPAMVVVGAGERQRRVRVAKKLGRAAALGKQGGCFRYPGIARAGISPAHGRDRGRVNPGRAAFMSPEPGNPAHASGRELRFKREGSVT